MRAPRPPMRPFRCRGDTVPKVRGSRGRDPGLRDNSGGSDGEGQPAMRPSPHRYLRIGEGAEPACTIADRIDPPCPHG